MFFVVPKRGVIHVKEKNMFINFIVIIGLLLTGVSAVLSVEIPKRNPKLYDRIWKGILFIGILGVIIASSPAVVIVLLAIIT